MGSPAPLPRRVSRFPASANGESAAGRGTPGRSQWRGARGPQFGQWGGRDLGPGYNLPLPGLASRKGAGWAGGRKEGQLGGRWAGNIGRAVALSYDPGIRRAPANIGQELGMCV